MDCLFCKIINGEIPSQKVYEDEYVYAFNDISPTAPVHVLIIPKKHISTINDIEETDIELIGKIFIAVKKIAKQLNIAEDGYRIISNCNKNAGQTVFHIHFHLIAGRELGWPAG
ncbi:MAG: histidine triad nucleotide-binding protein [Clostridia bacterium]|nr:histidine triad nucleotide-binding protein [Clostridia bacterium]